MWPRRFDLRPNVDPSLIPGFSEEAFLPQPRTLHKTETSRDRRVKAAEEYTKRYQATEQNKIEQLGRNKQHGRAPAAAFTLHEKHGVCARCRRKMHRPAGFPPHTLLTLNATYPRLGPLRPHEHAAIPTQSSEQRRFHRTPLAAAHADPGLRKSSPRDWHASPRRRKPPAHHTDVSIFSTPPPLWLTLPPPLALVAGVKWGGEVLEMRGGPGSPPEGTACRVIDKELHAREDVIPRDAALSEPQALAAG